VILTPSSKLLGSLLPWLNAISLEKAFGVSSALSVLRLRFLAFRAGASELDVKMPFSLEDLFTERGFAMVVGGRSTLVRIVNGVLIDSI